MPLEWFDALALIGGVVGGILGGTFLRWNWEGIRLRIVRWLHERRGERWRAQLRDGQLVCEACEQDTQRGLSTNGIIVNKPVDPDTPVDLDEPTQVLCQAHIKEKVESNDK